MTHPTDGGRYCGRPSCPSSGVAPHSHGDDAAEWSAVPDWTSYNSGPAHPGNWDLARVDAAPWPWTPVYSGQQPRPRTERGQGAYGEHRPSQGQRGRIVTKSRRETRHGLHLLLTLCTFGIWAITGWPITWAWNRFGPRRKIVTYTY